MRRACFTIAALAMIVSVTTATAAPPEANASSRLNATVEGGCELAAAIIDTERSDLSAATVRLRVQIDAISTEDHTLQFSPDDQPDAVTTNVPRDGLLHTLTLTLFDGGGDIAATRTYLELNCGVPPSPPPPPPSTRSGWTCTPPGEFPVCYPTPPEGTPPPRPKCHVAAPAGFLIHKGLSLTYTAVSGLKMERVRWYINGKEVGRGFTVHLKHRHIGQRLVARALVGGCRHGRDSVRVSRRHPPPAPR
jgi:hypothetical protein